MLQQAISSQEPATVPIEITPPSPLQLKFDALVMCNFTPRRPSTLPVSRWVSCANTAARTGDYRPPTHTSAHPLIFVCLSFALHQTGGCTFSFTRSLRWMCG
jgi:hypothetical protein